jgi:excisionase family DNA binding protein
MTLESVRNQQLTVREAAKRLGISPHTVRAWISTKKLGHVRLGRAVRVPQTEVDRLVAGGWIPPSRAAF